MGTITDARRAFSEIYDKNVWGVGSGVGSEPAHTKEYVAALCAFMKQYDIRSVVDLGCGDWQFSRFIDWSGIRYWGFDVVPSIVEANTQAFANETVSFHLVEDGVRLPAADLVICKDVLQHLPVADVRRHLALFKRLYKHALVTNDVWPEGNLNVDIEPGQCRPLRLDLPPFSETFEVLLSWDVSAYGSHSRKHTCHIRGDAKSRPAHIVLTDKIEAVDIVDKSKRSMVQAIREAIRGTPLAPVARGLRRFLRP